MSERDPIHQQAYHDAEAAWSIAKSLWGQAKGTPEAFQATFATVMIHIQHSRKTQPQSHTPQVQAGSQRAAPAAPAASRPAPTPAPQVEVPACPKCGGQMWDNRKGKKNPKAPDFKCRDKQCLDDKGFVTSLWVRDLTKNTAYAEAHAIRDQFDAHAAPDFNQPPAALRDDGDSSLPF